MSIQGNRRRQEQPKSSYVLRGTVASFHGCYGWISRGRGERDVYCYHADIVNWTRTDPQDSFRRLYPGETVEFELVERGRGPAAINVKVVSA